MSSVSIQEVGRKFGEFWALKDISLEIDSGEFVVLVGPSGCGKSTLLRLLAGLDSPDEGRILLNGLPLARLTANEANVAMVFQSYALYPHLSAFENIAFPLRSRRISSAEIRARVTEIAQRLGIADKLSHKPAKLSGGEKQRVALARALVRNPSVFLLDEPLSNLDAQLRHRMRAEILQIQRELSVTTVYVTHDQVEAMTMGQRILVLNKGFAQQVGPPNVIYQDPANIFVASFIGSPPMNLFSARATNGRLAVPALRISFDCDAPNANYSLGIRPQHLVPNGADGLQFDAVVELRESTGEETLLHCRVAEVEFRVVTREHPPAEGPCRFSVLPERLFLFDAAGCRYRPS